MLKEALTIKSAAANGVSRLEYMRRSELVDRVCRLGNYNSPKDPPDFSSYGRTEEELKMRPEQLMEIDIHREEDGWSRCDKHIMSFGN
jgi:hypothetical protein